MKKAIITLLLGCLFPPIFGQSDKVLEIGKYGLTHPYEKVYLHLDKPHYLPGDTVWFSAYTFLAPELLKDTLSIPLVVELYGTTSGDLLQRKHIELNNGRGYGMLTLSDTLKNDFCTVRAYTNFMRNYGEDAFFTKDISIFNQAFFRQADNVDQFELQFYPEGGFLIAGVENRVAFRGTNGNGRGVGVSGIVVASDGDTLLAFEDQHLGMGSFIMTPVEGKDYYAMVSYGGGEYQKVSLPEQKRSGTLMRVDNLTSPDQIKVYLQNQSLPSAHGKQWVLIATMSEKLEMQVPFEISDAGNLISIDKGSFPSGVLKLTLVDEDYKVMAERHVFINSLQAKELQFSPNKSIYSPRDTVSLDILLVNESGEGISGDFSVSVTDAGQLLHKQDQENILSYLLLSSELRGQLDQAGGYFDPTNRQAPLLMDLVMLTHDWQRYHWEKLLENEAPPLEHLMEKGLVLAGRVSKMNEGTIEKPHFVKVILNPKAGGIPSFFEADTDDTGNFVLFDLTFYDSVDVYVEAYSERMRKNKEAKQVKGSKVSLIPLSYPEFQARDPERYRLEAIDTTGVEDDYLIEIAETKDMLRQYLLNNEILLGEVTITARRTGATRIDVRDVQYGGEPTHSLIVDEQFYTYANVFHILRSRFPGVTVVGDVFSPYPEYPSILIRANPTFENAGGAQILIDGQPVDPGTAFNFQVAEIERIDILKGMAANAVFGSAGLGGTVNILTKRGNPNYRMTEDPRFKGGRLAFSTKGYSLPAPFHVPIFNPEIPPALQRDFRSTIYWSPGERADEKGKMKLLFPLSDGRTQVMVTVEGITDEGQPIFGQYMLQVE